jgi:DNA-binding response OmpR family regulator
VRTIEAEALDLVLADVKLSDGTGLDVARAAQERAVPLLFVTGECPEGARSMAVGCLAKPYGQRDLLEAIEAVDDVLSGRRRRRAPGALALFR